MNRPVCEVSEVGYVDTVAIVSLVAIAAVLIIWGYLIFITSYQGGLAAWKRGIVYYLSYSISIFGLLTQLTYSTIWELYWNESQPTCMLPKGLLFLVVLGFPLALIPPILINWRILCLFIPTYDYRCRKNSPMQVKDRGTKWLLIRFAILYAPSVVAYILIMTVGTGITALYSLVQSLLCALMIGVSLALIHFREQMQVSNPNLVKHALYTCGFSFLLAAVFVCKTVTFYVYPSDTFASNALDMSIAISVFLSALAVLLLWGHYLKYVGREPENSGRRLVLGKTLMDGDEMRVVFAQGMTVSAPRDSTSSTEHAMAGSKNVLAGSESLSRSGNLRRECVSSSSPEFNVAGSHQAL